MKHKSIKQVKRETMVYEKEINRTAFRVVVSPLSLSATIQTGAEEDGGKLETHYFEFVEDLRDFLKKMMFNLPTKRTIPRITAPMRDKDGRVYEITR